MLNDIIGLPAHALSRAIHAKKFSCVEVMQAYLMHIQSINPKLNALIQLRPEDELIKEAHEKDQQLALGKSAGWLHGIPQAPKDLTMVKDMVTTFGSPLFEHNVCHQDSVMIQRVRQAGAIFIGRTNVPEFGLGSHTYNPLFGVTANPYDTSKTAGGSSGGAAAALASFMLPVADGSDFGGSLRNPAAYCNIYGMRPSMGRVPGYPSTDVFFKQLATEGPMARTVTDLAYMLGVMAGPDPNTPLSLQDDPQVFFQDLNGLPTQKTVAWLGDWDGHLSYEQGISALCLNSLKVFEALGCHVVHTTLPFNADRLWSCWLTLRHFMAGSQLLSLYENPKKRAYLKPEAQWEVEGLRSLNATDVMDASETRSLWFHTLLKVFNEVDYLLIPSAQVFPFDKHLNWPKSIENRPMQSYHHWMEVVTPWTLAGLPVISIPVGFNEQGLPMGAQLIGKPASDFDLLKMAYAYEQATDWVRANPPSLL